jgi:hypothetical protein
MWTSQQPGAGNSSPVPNSCPGRFQLEPVCSAGPNVSRPGWPAGPTRATVGCPKVSGPSSRQRVMSSIPAVGGYTVNHAQTVPLLAVPYTSPGNAPPDGDAGRHPATPNGWGVGVVATCMAVGDAPPELLPDGAQAQAMASASSDAIESRDTFKLPAQYRLGSYSRHMWFGASRSCRGDWLCASYWGHYWGQTGVKSPNLNSKCTRRAAFEARFVFKTGRLLCHIGLISHDGRREVTLLACAELSR